MKEMGVGWNVYSNIKKFPGHCGFCKKEAEFMADLPDGVMVSALDFCPGDRVRFPVRSKCL